jgi:predicted RNA-binding protein with PIN domain
MSPWIVDGMNVIGSRPDGWWRDRTGAMRTLAADLARWAADEGEAVTLVLDGRERDLGETAPVEVRFAPHADDLIVELAAEDPGVRVATSDRELVQRLREVGVESEGAKTFRQRLG